MALVLSFWRPDSRLSLRDSGVRFQLAQSEFRKLEAYATKNSQPLRESSVV